MQTNLLFLLTLLLGLLNTALLLGLFLFLLKVARASSEQVRREIDRSMAAKEAGLRKLASETEAHTHQVVGLLVRILEFLQSREHDPKGDSTSKARMFRVQ